MCTETELQAKTETVFCTTVAFKRKKTVLKQTAGLISPVSTAITQVPETRQVSQFLKTDRSVCLLLLLQKKKCFKSKMRARGK